MQCTIQHPCPEADANLAVFQTLKRTSAEHHIGYSDHMVGLLAPVIAAALGAEVVEKHSTLDRSLPGTDQVLSVTPEELGKMVEMIHSAEGLLGDPAKMPMGSERAIINFVGSRFPK